MSQLNLIRYFRYRKRGVQKINPDPAAKLRILRINCLLVITKSIFLTKYVSKTIVN